MLKRFEDRLDRNLTRKAVINNLHVNETLKDVLLAMNHELYNMTLELEQNRRDLAEMAMTGPVKKVPSSVQKTEPYAAPADGKG